MSLSTSTTATLFPTAPFDDTSPLLDSDTVYGQMKPMVTSPLPHMEHLQQSSEGHVVYMGENEGVAFYQIWKPHHAKYVLQDNEKNYLREPTGSRFAPMTLGSRQSHENLIIGVDGGRWQAKRKTLRGSFVKKHVDHFVALATACCNDRMANWQSTENVSYRSFELMFSAILRYVLGMKAEEEVVRGAWQAIPGINRYFHNGLFTKKPIMSSAYDRDFSFCRHVFRQALEERAGQLRAGQTEGLGLLPRIAAKYDTTRQDEFEQMGTDIMSVSLAGADAPSVALAWMLYAVARYPEVQIKLGQEIDRVLEGRPPTGADLPQLRYARAVVQETLRLYPPAWYTPRTNVKDDVIDGVQIPAGSTVMVMQYLMHRDAEFWPDPDTFRPERFLENPLPQAYMPYGWGPRYCFAADYAHIMLMVFLTQVVQRFDGVLMSSEPPEINAYVNLRLKEDLFLGLIHR